MSYENDKLELQKILDDEKTDRTKKMAEIELSDLNIENQRMKN